MKLKALFIAAAASAVLAGPVSSQAFDLSMFGITAPQPNATALCDLAPSDDAFKSFHCPVMAEAMWWSDPTILNGTSRGQQLAYISAWIQAVHDPSVVWKVDSSVYSQLDPRLNMHVAYLAASNQDVLGEMMGESMGIFVKGFGAMLETRKQSVNSGTINPMGELGALLGGVANAAKPIALTTQIAQHDVMAWIGLAQRDPDAAIQLYRGIREIALNF